MQLADTHTHLYLQEFDHDRDEVIERAVSNNVTKLLMPNIDIHSTDAMLAIADKYPDNCYAMIGLHPTSVKEDYLSQLETLEDLFPGYRFIAIGEIGIDLYWDKTFIREQMEAFSRQVDIGLRTGLPVVIHSRESFPEIFSVLNDFRDKDLKGVFHAFSGNIADAEEAINMGFKLGIGGPLTFKNSKLDEIVTKVGIENIILETDSPYLAPVPHRGKRNESSYICIINRKLADIFNISEEEAAAKTFENSCRLFNI
jgi:TatD DNase family protein